MTRRALLIFLVAAMPLAAAADQIIGTPSGSGTTYQWTNIQIQSYDKIVLRIRTPNEDTFVKVFNYGTPLTVGLSELPGTQVLPGEYTWELRVRPVVSSSVQQQLQSARASGDFQQQRQIMIDNGLYNPPVQSGSFRVVNGNIVSTSGTEEDANDARLGGVSTDASSPVRRFGPRSLDTVVPDDLIVQASFCAGFDCVNGENFGFDTIRLKENNLRIHFDDTSTTAGYPNTDWRIIANDSANGGGSHLAVEDSTSARTPFKIKAGATTNSIVVDSVGNVGFSTSTPVLDFHIDTNNTPGIRLQQNNSGGFTAQTWDIAGNEASFFIRDQTGGSLLPFRIRPGAPNSSIDIDPDGNVGIGTASPEAKLEVFGTNAHVLVGSGLTDFLGPSQTGYGASNNVEKLFFAVQTGLGFLGTVSNTDLGLVTNNVTKVYVTAAGSVGVGTLAPSSKLHVSGGDIRVSGGSFIDDGTTLNVPDYVFEDSYERMTIEELAAFVRAEKHLPNVPSAREIANAGLNVSEFQMRLLEKIEELTLYTIELKAEIEALKSSRR